MTGRVVRASGAALAVLAMAAGGVAVGGGGAGAQSVLLDDVTGSISSGQGPCEPFNDSDGGNGLEPGWCDDLRWQNVTTVGDFRVWLTGRDRVQLGENAVVRTSFAVSKAGVELADATIRAPRGFEFKSGTVKLNGIAVEATFTVDPATGDVTVAAPDGGWTVPVREMYPGGPLHGGANMELTYRAAGLPLTLGETALRFSGSGVPDSGWVLKGATKLGPDLSLFGILDATGSS